MKTKLQKHLAEISPFLCIETIWTHDPDARFSELTGPGDAFENEKEEDWTAWNSEIRVSIILNGEVVTGSAYMGGTWERSGDDPRVTNPDISGYEPQMTDEALSDLRDTVGSRPSIITALEALAAAA